MMFTVEEKAEGKPGYFKYLRVLSVRRKWVVCVEWRQKSKY